MGDPHEVKKMSLTLAGAWWDVAQPGRQHSIAKRPTVNTSAAPQRMPCRANQRGSEPSVRRMSLSSSSRCSGSVGDHIQQQGDGLGVAAGTTAQRLGQIRDRHARHAPGVVGDDMQLIHFGDHQHTAGADAMGLPGHLNLPGGLLRRAAAGALELVTARQQLWRLVAAQAVSRRARAAAARFSWSWPAGRRR